MTNLQIFSSLMRNDHFFSFWLHVVVFEDVNIFTYIRIHPNTSSLYILYRTFSTNIFYSPVLVKTNYGIRWLVGCRAGPCPEK